MPVYGVNTGFGALAETAIPRDQLGALQLNLLRSHAAGVGEPLSVRAVRASMALRANVLAKGFSGIRPETLELLIAMLNRGVHPVVPSRGSVGASGDLAPLAHLALVLVGEGYATVKDSPVMPGFDALRAAGLSPITLLSKEGLALINGTQPSTAVAALALVARRSTRPGGRHYRRVVDRCTAGVEGPIRCTHPRRQASPGQRASAANILALMTGERHQQVARKLRTRAGCVFVALHRASAWRGARCAALRPPDRSRPKPMPPPTTRWCSPTLDEIVSGGNFHGAPISIGADLLAIAVTQFATISERRSDRLVNPALSGLAPFLTTASGLQSGYMIAQVTAAALTSELKTLAHPASVDTIPTSANKEDHVSMSMGAALKAERAVMNAAYVVAVEVLCACQAIDLLAPLTTSAPLQRVHAFVRDMAPTLTDDRPPAPDIERIAASIVDGSFERACGIEVK